jgi:GGDEF domain-containing protein
MSASGRIALPPPDLLKALQPAAIPAAILLATAVLASFELPEPLQGLHSTGPYAALAIAAALAWYFNRGRAFVVAASLLGAYAASQAWFGLWMYTGLAVLVPLNVLAAMLLPERGARYRAGYVWLAVFAVEGLFLAALHWPGSYVFMHLFEPMPLEGRIAFAVAISAAVWRAWPEATALQVGNAAALVAWFIAANWVHWADPYSAFMFAAGVILIVSMLRESHRLAFRDPLTGLPGRRALEERLRSLGSRYAIAMVDVDHFKKFNDTHGHHIGDQVLRLVAARLAEVEGGGIAFRYGGEEFSVLFPGSSLAAALPHLEALRASVEGYRMAVRAPGRPKNPEHGKKGRGEGSPERHLSVTVSIGACGPGEELQSPAQVVRAADEALYRAKQGGRNRVST